MRGKVMRMLGGWEQAIELARLMLTVFVHTRLCVCAFEFVVKEHCSQIDLCPAFIYLKGPSERKPVGVVRSTGTCTPRFIQTLPPQIS